MYEYKPEGTCSTKIHFDIRDNRVHSVSFENGCPGNLKSISVLAEGMDADELIKKLKGIRCGKKPTSCGDQFALALEKYK
ncbi:TSCPD domain-containing protein [Spirochaetia bacterium]|nr:TSCPD domain-containing protein [Spirochaetia bacterium]